MYILAFYFSKYDTGAVEKLGYSSFKNAREILAEIFDFNPNSLKNRRDDFDVLTGSHRTGWVSRSSTNMIQETNGWLQSFSFDELTALVQSFIENAEGQNVTDSFLREIDTELSEDEIEQIINFEDPTADLLISPGNVSRRVYRRSIIEQLKKLYHYKCQICGHSFEEIYCAKYAEAHHIDFFTDTYNNNANNIVILCPNHHRIIHKLKPAFDKNTLTWAYPNGFKESLRYNMHLL